MRKWEESEIELIKQNARKGVSYKDSATQIGRTPRAVTLKMQKLGYLFKDFYTEPEKHCGNCQKKLIRNQYKYCSSKCSAIQNNRKYIKRKKKCLNKCINCDSDLKHSRGSKYCCLNCQHEFNNASKLKLWLNGEDIGYTGKTKQLKQYIRKFLLQKSDYKCSKCSWCEIHPITNKVPLEINHIDGDACNCCLENLEVLCPNCHSLTHNFRALNKSSQRNRR